MNEPKINRRNILKLTAFGAVGAALTNQTAAAEAVADEFMFDTKSRHRRQTSLETADGVNLYYKDWGK